MAFGLDYVAGPSPSVLKVQGVTFVCRYLSAVNDLTVRKLLTANEAKALSQAGISIVSNYEWYANRALEGFASGVADAQIAQSQHSECGGPPDKPIYFSVDCDCAGEQTVEYFRGVASVLGLDRTGAYGSYRVIKYLLDNNLIKWAWQTYAWSGGAWDSRAHIQQYSNGINLAGHSVDYDRAMHPDFGAWQQGETMQLPQQLSQYFKVIDDQHIHCEKTGADLVAGHLAYWLKYGGIFRLPLLNEFRLAQWPNVAFQCYEGAIVAYDPHRQLDNPPTSEDCYLVHLDSGTGQAIVAKPLLVALQGQVDTLTKQVGDLTSELATLKAQPPTETSALEQQLSEAQAQLASFKQAVASVEATCAALPK